VWASSMPPLAGTGLQPPRFHPVFWKKGHMFTVADDPDRMHMPWQPPSFIEAADPKEQATKTTDKSLQSNLDGPVQCVALSPHSSAQTCCSA